MDVRCVILLGASITVVRCETCSSRQRRVDASSGRDASRASTLSRTPGQPPSHSCPQPRFTAPRSYVRPHQSTDYKVRRRKQTLCYSGLRPGTRNLVGDNFNTNTSTKPAELSTPQVPANETFGRVQDSFSLFLFSVAASYRCRTSSAHEPTPRNHASITALYCFPDWASVFGSCFCNNAAVNSTSRRPPAGPV